MYKKEKFSIIRKLFTIYSLLIIIIYAVLVGIIINNINQGTNQLVDNKTMQAENFLSSIEQKFDIIYNHEINLTNSGNVTRLAYRIYKNEYERSQIILDILQSLEGLKELSPIIEDIIITFPSEKITLSTNTGYDNKISQDWASIKNGTEYNYFLKNSENLFMNFTYPLMHSVSMDYVPDFNIQIVLSKSFIMDTLNTFRDQEGSGAAIIFDLEENYVIENGEDPIIDNYLNDPEVFSNSHEFKIIRVESQKYPVFAVAYIDNALLNRIQNRYILLLTIVMLLITAIYIFSLVYTKAIVIKPLQELIGAFDKIQDGNFNVRIFHEPHDEFNYLYRRFNSTVIYIQELISNIYEQEDLIQNAELAQLQSQINPHFLYNSFFIINRMAKNESYELITKFVTSLAKYYRFINKETQDFIPLEKEVEHMNNYLDIQQLRFDDKISLDQEDLPQEIKGVQVPKLILQPLIENAYNYGLANKLEDGIIKISYKNSPKSASIIIEDNGDDANGALVSQMVNNLVDNSKGGNHALFNIHKRLTIAFGLEYGLLISISPLGGIKIEVVVKK